jgi:hypothetical protein
MRWRAKPGSTAGEDRDDQEVTVSTDTGARGELLERIRARRASINVYVRDLEPRGPRLTNLSIICSAVVTALTAGPALGGAQFTEWSARLFQITDDSLVWRLLCFAAMVLSLVAAIATNLYKSHDIATRLAKAEACSAAMEGLEALVEFGRLPLAQAVQQYQHCVAEVPFIHEGSSASHWEADCEISATAMAISPCMQRCNERQPITNNLWPAPVRWCWSTSTHVSAEDETPAFRCAAALLV